MRVGAVGNRVLCGFPSPCGRVLCVRRDGGVHARVHSTSVRREAIAVENRELIHRRRQA